MTLPRDQAGFTCFRRSRRPDVAGFAATLSHRNRACLVHPMPFGPWSARPRVMHGRDSSLGAWPRDSDLLCPLLTSATGSTPLAERSALAGTRQTSRGKLDRFRRTTAGFTFCALDGYGLCGLWPAGPALTPQIRFLFIGPRLCLRPSFRPHVAVTPLGSAILHLHQVGPGPSPGAVKHARRTEKTPGPFEPGVGLVTKIQAVNPTPVSYALLPAQEGEGELRA